MSPSRETFRDRLQACRIAGGWSAFRLAKAAGLSRSGVNWLLEHGDDPAIGTVAKLAAALGKDPRWLAYGERDKDGP